MGGLGVLRGLGFGGFRGFAGFGGFRVWGVLGFRGLGFRGYRGSGFREDSGFPRALVFTHIFVIECYWGFLGAVSHLSIGLRSLVDGI